MIRMANSITSCVCGLALLGSLALVWAQEGVRFEEVAARSGIDFRYTFGDRSYENILESSGSGVTVIDYNSDGLMDLYLLNGTYLEGISDPSGKIYADTANSLYRNNGDGTFTDVSARAGLDDRHWSMAASPVDLDQDGFMDLYLLNYGANVFFHNNGNGTFTDITKTLGLQGPEILNGFVKWSIGAAFWDHNGDGRLDVMAGNFLAFDPEHVSKEFPGMMPHPAEYKGQASLLYEQQEDGGFLEVTQKYGLYYPDSKCMGLNILDIDDDGDLDIFQANDHQENFLFLNEDGNYTEVGRASGIATNSNGEVTGSMHATLGDVDGDGLIDILVTDLKYGALYRNMGNGIFEDITESSGIGGPMRGKGCWGASFLDFDNDGDLDLVTANGTAEELILQYPLLLENNGKGIFTDKGRSRGDYFAQKRSGRGLAVLDYDNDGDLDILISHLDLTGSAALLRNDGGNRGNWLGITLTGEQGIHTGMGARVTVFASGRKQVLVNQWSMGYLSSNDPRMHVGLGDSRTVESLEVKWPGGETETFENITANRYVTITKGRGIK